MSSAAEIQRCSVGRFSATYSARTPETVSRPAGIEQAFDHQTLPKSLAALVDAIVDPFLEFHRRAPAFEALFMAAAISPELAGRLRLLHETVAQRLTTLLEHRAPNAAPDDLFWAAEAAVGVFRGMLPLVSSLKGPRRQRAVRELKSILMRYLQPLLGA
jgi:hypothetical protein